MKIPELLAPVGSIEHLKIAIFSGASSVYLSGKKFGARKFAENFNLVEIKEAVDFAHLYSVKVYITVNTLIKDSELLEIANYITNLYKIGVDGVIIQDIGILKIIKMIAPKLTIIASTQMNIQNIDGLKWAKENGISRVVLPRELSYFEVKEMIDFAHSIDIEIETFVHGAICFSYSGRCLFSSLMGGRSGNRGTCAQPCRLKYQLALGVPNKITNISNFTNEDYILSPKDLSLYDDLDKLAELNIDSLKIEGRMRNTDYVATVVNQYRKALNQLKGNKNRKLDNAKTNSKHSTKNIQSNKIKTKNIKPKNYSKKHSKKDISTISNDNEELSLVFNRRFSSGHFLSKNNEQLMNRKKPGHQGLFVGKIVNYNNKTNEIFISLNSNLINIPKRGDGLLIESDSGSYGFDISNNPSFVNYTNDDDINNNKYNKNKYNNNKYNNNKYNNNNHEKNKYGKNKHNKNKHDKKNCNNDDNNRILLVKKVKENKKINISINKGSNVFLTKRKDVINLTKSIFNDKEKQSFKKLVVQCKFSIEKNTNQNNNINNNTNTNINTNTTINNNYNDNSHFCAVLEGTVRLANGKTIKIMERDETSWEIANNKPITTKQLKKQLLKIGDLPFYIEDIKINYSGNLFSPLGKINEFRRNFFNKLEKAIIDSYKPNNEEINAAEVNLIKYGNKLDISNPNIINFTENVINNKNHNINNTYDINNVEDIEKVNKENDNESNADCSLSIYINSIESLKFISELYPNKFSRIYLEIPLNNELNNFKTNDLELDISFYVNFLKEAVAMAENKSYELVWKWPDICHKNTKESLIKIVGILKKIGIKINVITSLLGMSDYLKNNFGVKVYGSHLLNVFNFETILNLKDFDLLTLSSELAIDDLKILMKYLYNNTYNYNNKNNNFNDSVRDKSNNLAIENSSNDEIPEIEVIIKGNIESLITRKSIISKNQSKKINKIINSNNQFKNKKEFNIYLNDFKNKYYPIKSIEGGNVLLHSKDISLEDKIEYLKSINVSNFSIDGRWKPKGYISDIIDLF